MDLVVQCIKPDTNEVCTCYFDSIFLGHYTSSDLLDSFMWAMHGLNLKKKELADINGWSESE